MARISPFEIEGFEELNQKIRRLEDDVAKRNEVLRIMRRQAKPAQQKYRANLPTDSETLSQSVAVRTVPRSKSGGNPQIAVRPGKRGRWDAYYQFMVIPKGARPGSRKRGSRKGLNTVVERARDRALVQLGTGTIRGTEQEVARYVQKRINQLSAA